MGDAGTEQTLEGLLQTSGHYRWPVSSSWGNALPSLVVVAGATDGPLGRMTGPRYPRHPVFLMPQSIHRGLQAEVYVPYIGRDG